MPRRAGGFGDSPARHLTMVTPEFITAWERHMRWLYALLARLEAQPERLVIDLQIRAVHRSLWRQYRLRDAIQDREKARDQ